MRAVISVAFFASVVGAVSFAVLSCTDLFHATDDIETKCELDAAACDLCIEDSTAAYARAQTSCAWLGACATPVGDNKFGTCMFNAILAYDCNANPNRRVKGKTRDLWECLSHVASCGDVSTCLFPGTAPAQPCSAAGEVACVMNEPVRFACQAAGATATRPVENCSAWGQACASPPHAVCASPGATDRCGPDAGGQSCNGTALIDCNASDGFGIDCASVGAQQCTTTRRGSVACVGEGDPCAPNDTAVTCEGTLAHACIAGVRETVDCQRLTSGQCHPGLLSPSWSLASACGSTATCAPDTCDPGNQMSSCAHGFRYSYGCGAIGMTCTLVTTADGSRAACAPMP